MRARALVLAAAAALAAAPSAAAAVRATELESFSEPVYVTAPPGDAHRLMVVEKAGTVRVLRDGVKMADPFLDIHGDVVGSDEQGLLSIAFAPSYATSHKLYAYYTTRSPRPGDAGSDIVIDEFTATHAEHVGAATRRRLVTIPHPANTNHDGGQLQFGPDGWLYAGTGDGGSGNDPPGNAQNPSSRLGKLLRLDPNGGVAVYASGLRNPYRFSFDRQTGDLTIGDVGQGTAEEIDFAPRGTAAGANYGWRCFEGFQRTASRCDTLTGFAQPVLEQLHGGSGFCAIIGGYVVRDPALSDLAGRYVYGDNCQSQVRSAVLATPRASDDRPVPGLKIASLSSFGEDICGHVYATSLRGPVYRIDGDQPPAPCPEPAAVEATAPTLKLTFARVQRALRRQAFTLAVTCDEACGFNAGGRMRIGRSKKRFMLASVSRLAPAGSRQRVRLRMSKRAADALRSALASRRRVTATLTVDARDAAGNERTATVSVSARG